MKHWANDKRILIFPHKPLAGNIEDTVDWRNVRDSQRIMFGSQFAECPLKYPSMALVAQ